MKFSLSSSLLLKNLNKLSGVLSNKPVIPILDNFLFDIKDNVLNITASDLNTTITTKVDVLSENDIKVAIPAKLLIETLKNIAEQPITFNIDEESNHIKIKTSKASCKLVGENGEEYPDSVTESETEEITVPGISLINGINKVIFATSNDDLRPAMSGVFFQVDFSKLTMVATDAHKLVRYTYTGIDSNVSTSFILPKKSLILLKSLIPETETVKVNFNDTNAFFKFGESTLYCRLVDAKYPDYQAVIPVDNPKLLLIERVPLLNSLKLAEIYSNKTTNQVKLLIDETEVIIIAQDFDFANEAVDKVPCTFTGHDSSEEKFEIGFNAKFLVQMLQSLDSEFIHLELSNPKRAGILRPSENVDDEDILMLVMPVRWS